MGDLIKSAFNYFGGPVQGTKENDLVGQSVQVGKTHFRIRRVIAEGGFAVVFEGYESTKGKSFAIKRLFSHDEESDKVVLNEINFLKKLTGHPNIIQFYGAASLGKEKSKRTGNEYLIVTELCSGGSLTDHLPNAHQQGTLPSSIVLQILTQTSNALRHMHKQSPPIIHRDMKVENLLLSENFTIKLCDFGSASTETFAPNVTWSAIERGRTQENLEKVTTPMYRAPEMLDLYLNYPINEALDIWAFGCIFFFLVCGFHPFEDSAKLAILNANFHLPPCTPDFEPFHNLIRQMLLVDPTQRPNINAVYGELSDLATFRNVPAFDSIIFNHDVKRRLRTLPNNSDNLASPSAPPFQQTMSASSTVPSAPLPQLRTVPPTRPSASPHPPRPSSRHPRSRHQPDADGSSSIDSSGNQPTSGDRMTSGVLGFLKGSAGHLIKNIRETSSKVMEAVTAAIPTDLDLKYITSRIAVMSYPAESGLEVVGSRNSMEEAQAFLDRHHNNSYAVYNLSSRAYRSSHWFHGRVSFRPLEAHCAPTLWSLVELCQNARLWLSQKPENVCIIHCSDGRQLSAVFGACLLCFCRVFLDAASAVKFFASKRGPVHLTAAQMRYIDYVVQLVAVPPCLPHNHPIALLSIILSPIPTFNRLKNGCRPYVEVLQGTKKVFSSMTNYESLRTYELEDRKIEIILNGISVYGDVTISAYHARSFFAGKGKASSVKICQLQFHTGFIGQDVEKISFMKHELDHLHLVGGGGSGHMASTAASRYAESFHTTLHVSVSPNERPRNGSSLVFPWETLPADSARKPMLCFADSFEMRGVMSPATITASGYTDSTKPVSDSRNSSPTGQDLRVPQEVPTINQLNESTPDSAVPPPSSSSQPSSSSTSSLCNAASATATLIEGLDWNQAPKTPTAPNDSFYRSDVSQKGPESRPSSNIHENSNIDDLLGFSSETQKSTLPTAPSSSSDTPSANPRDTPLFAEAFATPVTVADSVPTPWEDRWKDSVNLNPFDPFGTATEPPESPSKIPSADFDPLVVEEEEEDGKTPSKQFPMHLSNSTSNLSSAEGGLTGSHCTVQTSVSSSNLTRNSNPFEEFDAFFEAAAAAAASTKERSFAQSPSHNFSSKNAATPPTFGRAPFSNAAPSQSTVPPTPTDSHTASPFASFPQPGARSRLGENAFEDLLGDFNASGQSFKAQPNRPAKTLAEIRHQTLSQTEDPEALKIIQWLEGKEKNVRALLCTLGSVLWEGVRWEQISMADVMTMKQVKQQYRKAARAVHPDKWMNTVHVNMAKLILMELNEAMAEWERQEDCIS